MLLVQGEEDYPLLVADLSLSRVVQFVVPRLDVLAQIFGIRVYLSRDGKLRSVSSTAFYNSVIETLMCFQPKDFGWKLIRIGGVNDGGYLLPKDFESVGVCFSAGVGGDNAFETHLERFEIRSHLIDSIEERPKNLGSMQTFQAKYLGESTDENFYQLSDWIRESSVSDSANLMLKIDIESAEYKCLEASELETIRKFTIVIIEFHHLSKMLDPTVFYESYQRVLKFMTTEFDVVHSHPNNCCGQFSVENLNFPHILEVTFHRKDRRLSECVDAVTPNLLDALNVLENPEVIIDWKSFTNRLSSKSVRRDFRRLFSLWYLHSKK